MCFSGCRLRGLARCDMARARLQCARAPSQSFKFRVSCCPMKSLPRILLVQAGLRWFHGAGGGS